MEQPAETSRSRSSPDNPFARTFLVPAQRWYDEMRWTKDRPKVSKKRRLELLLSYAPDWIITILLAAILYFVVNKVYGFRREFSLTDTSIQHRYALKERVSVSLLGVLTVLVPIIIFGVISLGISRSFWDFHAAVLGIILTHAVTLTATTLVKVCVGRPRPDFIDRCMPRPGSTNATPYGLATESICTADLTSYIIQEGFRSFPSGHASTAFAGFTFLSLWLAGKLHLFQPARGHAAFEWIIFFPMVGATLISITRTMDYRHHATDVIAGSLLGFVVAVASYHVYYPPLSHASSHKPWPPRTSRPSMNPDAVEDDVERTPLTPSRAISPDN